MVARTIGRLQLVILTESQALKLAFGRVFPSLSPASTFDNFEAPSLGAFFGWESGCGICRQCLVNGLCIPVGLLGFGNGVHWHFSPLCSFGNVSDNEDTNMTK
jgi:hypothetical protein